MARKANTTQAAVDSTIATQVQATPETPKVTRARTTRARADVQEAFNEIEQEVADNMVDPKFATIISENEARIRKAVEPLGIEKAVQSLSTIGLEISRGLNQISESVVQKLTELQNLNDAVTLQKNELTRLHKIDVAATALDSMVADYNQKKVELENQISARTTEFDVMTAERKVAWAKEESDHARMVRERNEETEKQRRREVSDYEYAKNQERKLKEDTAQEQIAKLVKAATERQEILEKTWLARETELKARETELVDLRSQVASFPDTMKKEVSKAEAVLSNTLSKKYEMDITLLKKDMDTDKKLAAQEIAALQATIQNQSSEIASLKNQLASEKMATQNVIVKALDSASGQRTLQEVTNFANNQASANSKK